jgi:hypothetical protein
MGSLLQRQKQIEFRKRVLSFGLVGGGLALLLTGTQIFGLGLTVLGVYFTWDWFKFRAKNGMRF